MPTQEERQEYREAFEQFILSEFPHNGEEKLKKEGISYADRKIRSLESAFYADLKRINRHNQRKPNENKRGTYVISRIQAEKIYFSESPVRHASQYEAVTEAERLAKTTGKTFAVYKQIGQYIQTESFARRLRMTRIKCHLKLGDVVNSTGISFEQLKALELDSRPESDDNHVWLTSEQLISLLNALSEAAKKMPAGSNWNDTLFQTEKGVAPDFTRIRDLPITELVKQEPNEAADSTQTELFKAIFPYYEADNQLRLINPSPVIESQS